MYKHQIRSDMNIAKSRDGGDFPPLPQSGTGEEEEKEDRKRVLL
jgi:hypothetical protein